MCKRTRHLQVRCLTAPKTESCTPLLYDQCVGSLAALLPITITACYVYIDIHQLGTPTNAIISTFVFLRPREGCVSFVWCG